MYVWDGNVVVIVMGLYGIVVIEFCMVYVCNWGICVVCVCDGVCDGGDFKFMLGDW